MKNTVSTAPRDSSASGGFQGRLRQCIDRVAEGKWIVFARRAGIPKTTFQQYLDKGSLPGHENLLKIAAAGDVDANWLLTGASAEGQTAPRKAPASSRARRAMERIERQKVPDEQVEECLELAVDLMSVVRRDPETFRALRRFLSLIADRLGKGAGS